MNIERILHLAKEVSEVEQEVMLWRDAVKNDSTLFLFYTCLLTNLQVTAEQANFLLSETDVSASALGQTTHKPQESKPEQLL